MYFHLLRKRAGAEHYEFKQEYWEGVRSWIYVFWSSSIKHIWGNLSDRLCPRRDWMIAVCGWVGLAEKKKAEKESEAWMRWLLGKKECISLTTLLCCNPLYDSINNLFILYQQSYFFRFSCRAFVELCWCWFLWCFSQRENVEWREAKKRIMISFCSFNFTE